MHPAAVHAGDGLGEKARSHVQLGRDLAADQLVEQHLIRTDPRLGVPVVHLELGGSHLGVVLLIGEAHRSLDLGRGVDE